MWHYNRPFQNPRRLPNSSAAMAHRRCLAALARHSRRLLLHPSPAPLLPKTLTLPHSPLPSLPRPLLLLPRRLSSLPPSDDDDHYESGEEDDTDDDEVYPAPSLHPRRGSGGTEEQKARRAAGIGYKVLGPLDPVTEKPFKMYEPVYAVIQIGSHQFKVSNGDSIFIEKLKFCDVNDKLILNQVLMLGSQTQTMIGRPILPDAAVYAVVEEHAKDAKVIIFKKKRRKNYRRTNGHRQELTKLRITDIQGIDKFPKKKRDQAEIAAVAA